MRIRCEIHWDDDAKEIVIVTFTVDDHEVELLRLTPRQLPATDRARLAAVRARFGSPGAVMRP